MKLRKKLLSLLLTATLAAGLSTTALADYTPVTQLDYTGNAIQYTDVNENDWFHDNLTLLTMAGGINGFEDGTFRPNSGLRLCEFIKIVTAIMYPGAINDFASYTIGSVSDEEQWYAPYVGVAEAVGLLNGITYTREALEANVNRYNMAMLIVNAMKLIGETPTHDSNIQYAIGDYDKIPAKYREPVCDAYQFGILMGKDSYGSFCGNDGLTRAETCTVIMRLFEDSLRNYVYNEYWDVTDHCRSVVIMPEDWSTRSVSVKLTEPNFRVNYYCTAAVGDYGGLLFSVVITDQYTEDWGSNFKYLGLASKGNEKHYVYVVYPGDTQYDYSNAEMRVEYVSMQGDMNDGRVKITVTMHE